MESKEEKCRGVGAGAEKGVSIIKLQVEKVGDLRGIEGFEGMMGLPAYLILKWKVCKSAAVF